MIVDSGVRTREIVADRRVMERLKLDPPKQLIAARCSGALVLARLANALRHLEAHLPR